MPRTGLAPKEVREEAVTVELIVVPVSVPAGAITAAVEAAVASPLPFNVITGIAVDDPKVPVLELTVASVPVIAVAPLPDKSPDRVIV